jgi:DNA-binding LacI/PurR family transcriptional regulator
VPYDESLVSVGDFTAAGGYAAASQLLEQRPDVDAIFAASDLAAFGVIRAVQESGRTVRDDVAVVGFDDIPAAADHVPPLTTVRQPIAELGTTMTHHLLDRVRGDSHVDRSTVLPVELVQRETS